MLFSIKILASLKTARPRKPNNFRGSFPNVEKFYIGFSIPQREIPKIGIEFRILFALCFEGKGAADFNARLKSAMFTHCLEGHMRKVKASSSEKSSLPLMCTARNP